MSFAEKLKTLRLENDMTQEYIASRLNLARSTIAGYETKNRQPSHEKLTAIANLFQVSVDYLLDDNEALLLSSSSAAVLPVAEQELLSIYRTLSERSQKDLREYIQLLELRDQRNSP